MKVRAQIAMVLNLDKCIGCHTCSVTCKRVWTSRKGVEYAWFNNVETKPGTGYPTDWENQGKWKGGWVRTQDGNIHPRMGGKLSVLSHLFANPDLPDIDQYYEPFDFDYGILQSSLETSTSPTARPISAITGQRMKKIEKGPNWEDDLGGDFASRSQDQNLQGIEKEILGQFENTFMLHLPRLCEHCLNPACVAVCPSGAIYKREEDGIVLIDQDKCRGWRMCISGCPYKKIYYNWQTGKSEKCILCYPRLEHGDPTLCAESCVGRIRYMGVLLYDADQIAKAASVKDEQTLYEAQLSIFLNPFEDAVITKAREEGIPEPWLEAARKSPVYKLAIDWKLALPLHPEYRTLPMIWYVPPLSPIQSAIESRKVASDSLIPDVQLLRIPIRYLANLFTAGYEKPIEQALERMLAMRVYMRDLTVNKKDNAQLLTQVGLTTAQVEEMYRYLAIAKYEDRFVIPPTHRQYAHAVNEAFLSQGSCGFTNLAYPTNSAPLDTSQQPSSGCTSCTLLSKCSSKTLLASELTPHKRRSKGNHKKKR